MATKKELKIWIAKYQEDIDYYRRRKSAHQEGVKKCAENIKSLQTRIAKMKAELKSMK